MKNDGFILITALIFILLISLFAYQALESMILEIKLHQVVKRQKFLFDLAQENLKKSENDLENHCSIDDQKNKNRCVEVEVINDPNNLDQKICIITSKTFQNDMAVILQSRGITQDGTPKCKRQSWRRES